MGTLEMDGSLVNTTYYNSVIEPNLLNAGEECAFHPATRGGSCDPRRVCLKSSSRGRVAKWSKARDCKSRIRGFESHRGL